MKIEEFKAAIGKDRGLARPNLWRIYLPNASSLGIADPFAERDSKTLDLMCNAAQLPGRQITTNERMYGMKSEKMPYGYIVDDVSLTFYDNNDYSIKRYWDGWQDKIISRNVYEVKYKNEYAREVTIQQLDHQGGEVYTCVLSEAFPTTVNVIELNNDQDGLVLVNVQLAFTDWR